MPSPAPPAPARLLAPMALVGALVAFIVVVATSFGGDPATETETTPSRPDTSKTRTGSSSSGKSRPAAKDADEYVVKPGDNLVRIAEKTGVEVETLQELNPDLDPQALVSGQRVRLTEDAATSSESDSSTTSTSTVPELSR